MRSIVAKGCLEVVFRLLVVGVALVDLGGVLVNIGQGRAVVAIFFKNGNSSLIGSERLPILLQPTM